MYLYARSRYVFNCVHPGTKKKPDSELHIFAVHAAHRQTLSLGILYLSLSTQYAPQVGIYIGMYVHDMVNVKIH